MAELESLAQRLNAATGADGGLDEAIAGAFGVPPGRYSGSLDACRALVAAALPGWRLHLGFDAAGIFPYAALSQGEHHLEAEAPTLPLAILKAAVAAAKTLAPAPGASPVP